MQSHGELQMSDLINFSARDTSSSWLQELDLSSQIYHHLGVYVPMIYSRSPDLDTQSEERSQMVLLSPLEWFLCGEEPSVGLAKLEGNRLPSHLCGHIFKVGEPNFSCRDCATDPTCVLCMQCFLGSVHKEHRYKMNMKSGGGGVCDCGDVEAWKIAPSCQKHQPNLTDSREDPLSQLSADMTTRIFNVFSVVLKYAVDMLTWEREDQLPPGLAPPERAGDSFCCMLFNDEVHTYEQVINTLMKAVSCTQKEAVSFASTVNRDGRTCVRFGDLQFCEQAKSVIVSSSTRYGQTKPLRVQVMHSSVVAHQCFALKALSWLGQIIGHSDALRRVLCQVLLQRGPEEQTPVDTLMLCDFKMWKGARNAYYQLLVSTLLMDLKYKNLFAIHFAKNYEQLQDNYAKDPKDHNKEDSITSLSVQIFTVPSLARMLMIEEDLMKTIIKCCMGHLRHKQFDLYILSLIKDLNYVLTCRPAEWTDPLREKFLEGLDAFLELLKCMQGADPILRQQIQVPEWRVTCNLQIILTPVISLIQQWCASDERVLIEAYRKVLCALSQCNGSLTKGEQPIILGLAGHSIETIPYLVSKEEVSIHLPVSRLLAGLHVLLSKTELAYRCPERLPLSELSPPTLIEYPLRCLVFCAQVHAKMWRVGGFSRFNMMMIDYYHSMECRGEMFDKDLIMLQVGASMMDPDHFLMVVLNRFELFHVFGSVDDKRRYSRDTNMDVVKQNNTLIEEMLHVIIMVAGERYMCGISKVHSSEEIRREIIHQLSTKAMSHSELLESLPENVNEDTGIDKLIDSVALFKKKPGVAGRGLYELRPECSNLFNPYFYHYSRSDRSMAEAQRKLKRQNGENSALLPHVLPPFCPLFASLVNLLQCDVLLVILGAVLQWAVEPNTGHWSECMLQRVLHLIGMSLLEEQQQIEKRSGQDDITFNLTSKISCPVDSHSNSASILTLLETLRDAPHLEVHKDMVHWILMTVSNIKTVTEQTVSTSTVTGSAHVHNEAVREKDKEDVKRRKKKLAHLRRKKLMAQMSEMQKLYYSKNRELFEKSLDEMNEAPAPDSLPDAAPDVFVCVGPGCSGSSERQLVTCILCQEKQEVKGLGQAMVMAAFVQRSTVMSQNRSAPLPDPEHHDPLFPHPELNCGTHTGSCGHVMHASCWQRYFEYKDKERRRQLAIPNNTLKYENGEEFSCPLCRRLSNAVIPILPRTHRHTHSGEHPSLEEWLKLTSQQVAALYTNTRKGLNEEVLEHTPSKRFSSDIMEMMSSFGMATYKVGLNVDPNDLDIRVPIMSWNSCAFTIQSIERHLADEERPLFESLPCRQDECLTSLCRFASVCWMSSSPPSAVHFIRLFSAVVPDLQVENTPCILDVDMFHLLVSSLMSYSSVQGLDQSRQSTVDSAHLHLFHLLTVAHLVQILVTSVPGEVTMDQESGGAGNEEEEEELTFLLYNKVRSHLDSLPEVCSGRHLWRCVKKGLQPFLRSAAMFFTHLNSTRTPSALQVAGGPGQWEALCTYLSLPSNLLQLYNRHRLLMDTLIQGWCCHTGMRQALQGDSPLVRYPRQPNRLIELPEDYSSLIKKASSFTCPSAPTMCLVCGAMLCSLSYCCVTEVEGENIGACTAHSYTCGAGLGIFLRIRDCRVLFLSGKTKACFYAPPYLDDYGETDVGLRRGNPLHLCSDHYLKIQRLWRLHSITEEIGWKR